MMLIIVSVDVQLAGMVICAVKLRYNVHVLIKGSLK